MLRHVPAQRNIKTQIYRHLPSDQPTILKYWTFFIFQVVQRWKLSLVTFHCDSECFRVTVSPCDCVSAGRFSITGSPGSPGPSHCHRLEGGGRARLTQNCSCPSGGGRSGGGSLFWFSPSFINQLICTSPWKVVKTWVFLTKRKIFFAFLDISDNLEA